MTPFFWVWDPGLRKSEKVNWALACTHWIHYSLLLTVDVMWTMFSSSCCCDFLATMNSHLEIWAEDSLESFSSCFFQNNLSQKKIKIKKFKKQNNTETTAKNWAISMPSSAWSEVTVELHLWLPAWVCYSSLNNVIKEGLFVSFHGASFTIKIFYGVVKWWCEF